MSIPTMGPLSITTERPCCAAAHDRNGSVSLPSGDVKSALPLTLDFAHLHGVPLSLRVSHAIILPKPARSRERIDETMHSGVPRAIW